MTYAPLAIVAQYLRAQPCLHRPRQAPNLLGHAFRAAVYVDAISRHPHEPLTLPNHSIACPLGAVCTGQGRQAQQSRPRGVRAMYLHPHTRNEEANSKDTLQSHLEAIQASRSLVATYDRSLLPCTISQRRIERTSLLSCKQQALATAESKDHHRQVDLLAPMTNMHAMLHKIPVLGWHLHSSWSDAKSIPAAMGRPVATMTL